MDSARAGRSVPIQNQAAGSRVTAIAGDARKRSLRASTQCPDEKSAGTYFKTKVDITLETSARTAASSLESSGKYMRYHVCDPTTVQRTP